MPCGKLARELARLWKLADLTIPMGVEESLYLADEKADELESIKVHFLTSEENTCRWLRYEENCEPEEIARYLGKTQKQVLRILKSANVKYEKAYGCKPGKNVILIRDRDNPLRRIIVLGGGYPEIKRGRGRPGKYELKKDYDFYRKYLKQLKKMN